MRIYMKPIMVRRKEVKKVSEGVWKRQEVAIMRPASM